MQLPYWLLTFEELVEVLIGEPRSRKAEIEILQELIPHRQEPLRHGPRTCRQRAQASGTPEPARFHRRHARALSHVRPHRTDRRAHGQAREQEGPLTLTASCKTRIEIISQDPRYAFMFGSLTVYDGMAQILGRIFRVPVNGKPITILELTGLPSEIVNVVVSVLCRMTFDFALYGARAGCR